MDEEEIETWYDEQKERLTEKYRLLIEKAKNKEKIEKEFRKELDKLHKKYERLSDKTIKRNLERFFFNYRLEKIKKKIFMPFIQIKEKFKKAKKE